MARLCERPGCSTPADVGYGFDADQQLVWIDGFDTAAAGRSGVLCRRHADAMVVPLGWMLDDRRNPTPQLFRPPVAADGGRPVARHTERSHGHRNSSAVYVSEQLDLDSTSTAVSQEPTPNIDQPATSVPGPADPWKPVFDQTDDLDGLLSTEGRLLSRAFHGRRVPVTRPVEPPQHT